MRFKFTNDKPFFSKFSWGNEKLNIVPQSGFCDNQQWNAKYMKYFKSSNGSILYNLLKVAIKTLNTICEACSKLQSRH